MQSYPEKKASLHQLLKASAVLPEYVQVKPRGFKAILRSTAEFLEAHQIKANLLTKLPTGLAWQDDIQRYGQSLTAPYQVINFTRPRGAEPAHDPTATESVIPLPDAHTWRGDYFVVIQSEDFVGLVVAHRLQPLSASPLIAPEEEEDGDGPVTPGLPGSNQRSSYLLVSCSINPPLIATVMAAIHQQVSQMAAADPDDAPVAHLLAQWSRYDGALNPTSPHFLERVDQWLTWQLRLQEHLRQSAATYRRQAMGLSTLSSQNEVLLNTLRLKDNFLNTVGQELRTPLTTIKTALTLLDSPQLKPPQRQRYMGMISHECDRQSALISGVLDLLQMETSLGKTQLLPLRLADTVPPVVSTYQPLAEEKGVMLAYTIPSNMPVVACPDVWLRQIMIHLLNNSIKYTTSGGEVWVTARAKEKFAEIEIRDTGVGISPSDLPNIFEHFYRGRNLPEEATEGAGLGLSIVRQLLTSCDGSIVVSSQPGQGTTFVVRLPWHQS